ncbi:MAG: hypothetical protein C0508_27270 [Cyanobacteria bacterium PR.023]|nr:hypothetical protein [Cyanobacteria bacterium PR.023]
MQKEEWELFIQEIAAEDPVAVVNPGTSLATIEKLEDYLGKRLPPSYRSLLQAADGFAIDNAFFNNLLNTHEVEWFSVANTFWIECYALDMADSFGDLYGMLQISSSIEGVLLLNPARIDESGEWEALLFANFVPGAERFPNLDTLLQHLFFPEKPFVELLRNEMEDPIRIDAPFFWANKPKEAYLRQIRDNQAKARAQAINALAFHADSESVLAIITCLNDEDELVQSTAAKFLKSFENAAPALESLIISNAGASAKLDAAESLQGMNVALADQAVSEICHFLQADAIPTDWAYLTDWAYRASRILGKTKNLLAIAPLASAIRYWLLAEGVAGFSPIATLDVDFRSFGANALPALKELVSDESVVVRLHALKLLEFDRSEASIALLEQASQDSCKEVSDLAKSFLKKTSS